MDKEILNQLVQILLPILATVLTTVFTYLGNKIKNAYETKLKNETAKIIVDDKLWKYQYTYQVLDVLHEEYSNDILYLVIGADNIINFHLWKNYQEIIRHNKILVLPRYGIDSKKYFDNDNFIIVDGFKEINISSSEIRDKIKNSLYDELKEIIDDKVINYIIENKLYE